MYIYPFYFTPLQVVKGRGIIPQLNNKQIIQYKLESAIWLKAYMSIDLTHYVDASNGIFETNKLVLVMCYVL